MWRPPSRRPLDVVDVSMTDAFSRHDAGVGTYTAMNCAPGRHAGVFSRTRPAGGGQILPPLPNSRTNRRSEAGEAAIESPEREDSNALQKFS